MSNSRILVIGLALMLGGGCAPRAVGVSGYAEVGYPSMAYVDGMWVVLGQDYPLFYDSGFYWMWYEGAWLRSPYYDRGFVRVTPRLVPGHLYGLDRPRRYRYYQPRAGVRVYRAPRYDQRYDRRHDQRYYDRRYQPRYDDRYQRRPPPRTTPPRTTPPPRTAPPRTTPPARPAPRATPPPGTLQPAPRTTPPPARPAPRAAPPRPEARSAPERGPG